MKVINLWGSPGSGKSTVAAGLFYRMKMADYNVELICQGRYVGRTSQYLSRSAVHLRATES